jgi:sec-independent protein translocase protein TatB
MFGISWMELMVIVGVALILFGPNDLPAALRTLARSLRVIRRMAREFQTEVDQLIRDSELDAVRRDVEETVRGKQSERPLTIPRAPAETHGTPLTPSAQGHVPAPSALPATKEVDPTSTRP